MVGSVPRPASPPMRAMPLSAVLLWLALASPPATAAVTPAPGHEPLFIPHLPALAASGPRILLCRVARVDHSPHTVAGSQAGSGALAVESVLAGGPLPPGLRLPRLPYTPAAGDLLLLLIERVEGDGTAVLAGTGAIPVDAHDAEATAQAFAAVFGLLASAPTP